MTGYNDPKVTKPAAATKSNRMIWYAVGGVVILLVLAWAFGMFSGAETVMSADPAMTTAPSDTATTPPAEPVTPVDPVTPAAPAE